MTPDNYLDPKVEGVIRFESGRDYMVAARPRKGAGITDESVIGLRPVEGRRGSGIPVWILRRFASIPDQAGGAVMGVESPLTTADAAAILKWVDEQNREGER